ncbi:hypothetical protein GCK32_011226 [Trichostrongylus colubriformis]|uniref:Uncharacterized protein n=1 Tax=Trichostrongylus colubriformis TaxID=6319 RepID=A0AAN8F4Q6_TRICO
MLLIVAVFGVFLVNTNALTVGLDSFGGILTPGLKKAFESSMKSRNRGLDWDDGIAEKEALAEAEQRGSSEQPLVIYHKWKTQNIRQSSIPLAYFAHVLDLYYGMWVPFLPAKTRYGCNGILNISAQKVTAACVFKPKK